MDIEKIKVGSVYKFIIHNKFCGQVVSVAGLLKKTENILTIIHLDGTVCSMKTKDIINITSTRISSDVRSIMRDLIQLKTAKAVEEERHMVFMRECDDKVHTLSKELIEATGLMSPSEFEYRLQDILEKHGYRHMFLSGWENDGSVIELTESKSIQKYASPESYSFIYREYDGCCFLNSDSKEAKKFAKENAPVERCTLKKIATAIEKYLELGDKNWLSANTTYKIKLAYGFSQQSLKDLETKL